MFFVGECEKTIKSDFLFARPNFLSGVAATFDLGGTLVVYNDSESENEADLRAIASDWAITGEDIETSVETFQKNQNKNQTEE